VDGSKIFMQFGRFFAAATCLSAAIYFPFCACAETPHHHHRKTESLEKNHKKADSDKKPKASDKAAPEKVAQQPHEAKVSGKHSASRQKRVADFSPRRIGSPQLRSSAYLVQDLQTGEILLQKNAEDVQPMASLTKLMTAMVVLDAHQNMEEELDVTEDDVDHLKNSISHLTVGSRLTRRELLHLALMASENRAASALARNYPGGMPAFLVAVNTKARTLGLRSTHYDDGTGLNKGNVSSARELATIVATAARYPLIHEFSTSTELTVEMKGGEKRAFHNTDALVKNSRWDIDVSKTGHINESGQCLVIKTRLVNRNLAIVLLNSQSTSSRLEDAVRVRQWLESSSRNLAKNRDDAVGMR